MPTALQDCGPRVSSNTVTDRDDYAPAVIRSARTCFPKIINMPGSGHSPFGDGLA